MDMDVDRSPSPSRSDAKKIKGRGGRDETGNDGRYKGSSGVFQTLEEEDDSHEGPARSIEGWIIVVTGIHEEATEEDIHDAFDNFGTIKNLHLNLDRRTGYVKGYAFIEYETLDEAKGAIEQGKIDLCVVDQRVDVDWGFCKLPGSRHRRRGYGN